MRQLPVTRLFAWICVLGLATPLVLSAQPVAPVDPATLDAARQRLGATLAPLPAAGVTGCVQRTIACNSNRFATINTLDCATDDFSTFFDLWVFSGLANQQVTINMTSNELDPFLLLLDPDVQLFADDDDGGPGFNARIQTTLDQTGQWAIAASGFPGLAQTGAYTLSLACQTTQPQPCIKGPETLCLSDGRFRVEVDWATNQGTSGDGRAVELTPDTGYFWFFDQSNVEMVIKVLDACSFANRFWVFAGGLTNVEVEITVTDTERNVTKTYHNPLNTAFQPIQDTSAFATCP